MGYEIATTGRRSAVDTSEGFADACGDLRSFVTVSRTHPSDIQERTSS